MPNLYKEIGFSQDWDVCYHNKTQLSIWPWSDMVSLVHRYCKPLIAKGHARVLEVGCGAGANIPFFLGLGMEYYAIEGSKTIVNNISKRYPQLKERIYVGDFTLDQPFNEKFDIVIDRASMTHNNTLSIKRGLKIAMDSLKTGGLYIGVDWFSMNHSDYLNCEVIDDDYTRTGYVTGQFNGVGKVHFSDERHLRELFEEFKIILLEEKIIDRREPNDFHIFAAWNIVAIKN